MGGHRMRLGETVFVAAVAAACGQAPPEGTASTGASGETGGTAGTGSTGVSEATSGATDTGPGTSGGSTGGSSGGSTGGPDLPEYLPLFEPDHLPVFELTIPPDSWAAIDAAGQANQTYQPGTFRYEDTVLDDVGIRLKGRASFQTLDEKPAFKIKFGEFVQGQRFMGLRRLTLNNQTQDASAAHERLGYELFRAAGVDAPLCNAARVYVNGEYYGLYANVQSLDKTFVEDHYPGLPVGNLYDTYNDVYFTDLDRSFARDQSGPNQEMRFQLETNTTLGDLSGLTLAIDAVYNGDQVPGWYTGELEQRIDLTRFLEVGAVQGVIADWDGFFGARNNYKIYHAPDTDLFVLYPWGIDQTFGSQAGISSLGYCIDGSTSDRVNALLFERCKGVPACWDRYATAVQQALAAWDTIDFEAELDAIELQIASSVLEDTRSPFTYAEWEGAMAKLREFVSMRRDEVTAQLGGASCP